jgi:hypothetical protein
MSEEIEMPNTKGSSNMALGLSAFMFYIALFILIMDGIPFALLFCMGGILFIAFAIDERIRSNNWMKADMLYFISYGIVYSIYMGIMLVVFVVYVI